ncbi:MAG: hypothetical protein PVH61_18975 [Candidatus Aminicenantes bacterium]|jgi:hypothetical protein
MKPKKISKKLSLKKETITNMLKDVKGGYLAPTFNCPRRDDFPDDQLPTDTCSGNYDVDCGCPPEI